MARKGGVTELDVLVTCGEAVKYAVLAQDGVTVGADQHARLSVAEDVVLLQQA